MELLVSVSLKSKALESQHVLTSVDEAMVDSDVATSANTAASKTVSMINTTSPGAFPVCTEFNGTFAPFCLPHNEEELIVDATYYVTWNADYYPLNATITIELRYPSSSNGDSAYTSERTENSYGYIPLHMERAWLQGKPRNSLTLYIIELDATSDRRASIRQGPTVTLHPQPPQHYKPTPRLAFNKFALMIGLPLSLCVVVGIVGGLYFGMRDTRKIGLGNIMGSSGRNGNGYGAGKSRDQRLNRKRQREFRDPDELSTLKKFSDDIESSGSKDLERSASRPFTHELWRLKSWSG